MEAADQEIPPQKKRASAFSIGAIACFIAFAFGIYVKGEVQRRESVIGDQECRISIEGNTTDGKLSTDIHAEGSKEVCAGFLAALQAQSESDAPDGQDGQATDDQQAPCDSDASAPQGASQ